MTNQNIILLIIIGIVAVGALFYFMDAADVSVDPESEIQYNADGSRVSYCDENGNRYDTTADAKAAGLSEVQYGATYCPEYVAAQTGDYTGTTPQQAQNIAEGRDELFRVVEIDGEMQPTTKDIQEGRINAVVEEGIITSFTVESGYPTATSDDESASDVHDEIIGMTTAEAEAYAEAKEIDFRIGTIDGEGMPNTDDFRPGRITAETAEDIVVGYTVE